MKFEKTEVWGFEHAIRGMRQPLQSHSKSDSYWGNDEGCLESYVIGPNDMKLMKTLIKAGPEHRKFLRQIFISVDITAPLYWWKEFDTYKVGTVANSCSTMHKLKDTPITRDCFEMSGHEDITMVLNALGKTHDFWYWLIDALEYLRQKYLETKDKKYWYELIRMLPESWLQKRTVTMSYENVANMYSQRMNHKLTEWSKDFIQWADNLPYFKELFTV